MTTELVHKLRDAAKPNLLRWREENLLFTQAADEIERIMEQRYVEACQHAGCLVIAEGGPGWENPTAFDSNAMVAVRDLRQSLETLLADYEAMVDDLDHLEIVINNALEVLDRASIPAAGGPRDGNDDVIRDVKIILTKL